MKFQEKEEDIEMQNHDRLQRMAAEHIRTQLVQWLEECLVHEEYSHLLLKDLYPEFLAS